MGFIIPAIAAGTCLLLTQNDTALQHRVSYYSEAGFSWGYKYPYTFMPQINSGINYQLRKFLSAGIEFGFYLPADRYNQTAGIGVRPFARFYPVNNNRFTLYFESGGGLVYFFQQFPKPTARDSRTGTQLNGITKYGMGATLKTGNKTTLQFGIRHLHISNGNSKGAERNPSHDSNGVFVGLSKKL